jgi:hypothetical protein
VVGRQQAVSPGLNSCPSAGQVEAHRTVDRAKGFLRLHQTAVETQVISVSRRASMPVLLRPDAPAHERSKLLRQLALVKELCRPADAALLELVLGLASGIVFFTRRILNLLAGRDGDDDQLGLARAVPVGLKLAGALDEEGARLGRHTAGLWRYSRRRSWLWICRGSLDTVVASR